MHLSVVESDGSRIECTLCNAPCVLFLPDTFVKDGCKCVSGG